MSPSGTGLRNRLAALPEVRSHEQWEVLLQVVTGETGTSSSGFPYICEESFERFRDEARHLFIQGREILRWIRTLDERLEEMDDLSSEEIDSLARAEKVIKTMVFTASVTAVPDLCLLRLILSTHKKLGHLDWLLAGNELVISDFARERNLDERQLRIDLSFLHSRGYLERTDHGFQATTESARIVLEQILPLPAEHWRDLVADFRLALTGAASKDFDPGRLSRWFVYDLAAQSFPGWVANLHQIETGYRLLPIVVALHAEGMTKRLTRGVELGDVLPQLPEDLSTGIHTVFEQAGLIDGGCVTELGARVCARGAGPYGIIGSYHPYLTQHEELLREGKLRTWVRRAANVAASQDANRGTFQSANASLDAFCQKHGWEFRVFIEHAIGKGEATRQRFEKSGDSKIRYVGADLEDAAIDEAVREQAKGNLPKNMTFVRSADIGDSSRIVSYLESEGLTGEPTVMMVGNGFHEVRGQTNEKMVDVFRGYCDAGIALIFVEESALSDEQLRETAWNTYHAGFRFVHEISGQGLRPAWEGDRPDPRFSWSKCASMAGYVRVDSYSNRTRTIFPYAKGRRSNPSISVTHFCIPHRLADELGIVEDEQLVSGLD